MKAAGNVRDNQKMHRFELQLEGAIAFANYQRAQGVVTITHTEVPGALRGKGIGSVLVRGMLDIVRERGEKVVPACDFVEAFIEGHKTYRDLLAR